jgi:hypothetical protein
MPKRAHALILLVILLITLPIAAQDDLLPWQAWVYLPQTGQAWLINERGEIVNEVQLLAEDGATFSPYAAVSPDGSHILYSTIGNDGSHFPMIYDVLAGESRSLIEADTSITADSFDFAVAPAIALNRDSAHPASVVYGFQTESGWRLIVIDSATGEIVAELASGDEDAANADEITGGDNPVPYFYNGEQVIFALVNQDDTRRSAFRWSLIDNTVTPDSALDGVSPDFFAPTGEAIYHNVAQNTLNAVIPQAALSFPFYQDNTLVEAPILPRFAGEGNYILATNDTDQVMIIGRDGVQLGRLPSARASELGDVRNLNDGFLYTTLSSLVYVDITDGVDDGTPVAFLDIPPELIIENPLRILWAQDGIISSPGPFLLWNNLTGNDLLTISSQIVMTVEPGTFAYGTLDEGLIGNLISAAGGPAVGGQSGAPLEMGGQGIVTAAGAPLGMYYEPDINAIRLVEFPESTLFNVLEGPVFVGEDQWWRVGSLGGQDGWVIAVSGADVWVAGY